MRLICALALLAAYVAFSAPTQALAADLGYSARTHATKSMAPQRAVHRGRAAHRVRATRVAYSDCRTGWWSCRCTGETRSPVWATRCR